MHTSLPWVNLKSLTVEYTGGQEKDLNTRSGVRARLLKLCRLPIFRKTQLNDIIVTDIMHRRLEKNSVSGVES